MTTWLSRLVLNPLSREVRRDLADCQRLHQRVMSVFPDDVAGGRSGLGVLHRVEAGRDGVTLLVQSTTEPDWTRLPEGYVTADFFDGEAIALRPLDEGLARLAVGQTLRFRLRANPSRKVETKSAPDGSKRNGKRVPLRNEASRHEWLTRRASTAGFAILEVSVAPGVLELAETERATVHGMRRAGNGEGVHRVTVEGVVFEGRLRVVDVEAFRAALRTGIGPGKAYGFGLLSVPLG